MVVPHPLSSLSKVCISTSLGCYIQLPQVDNEYFFLIMLEGWNYEVRVSESQGSGGDVFLSGKLNTSLCILKLNRERQSQLSQTLEGMFILLWLCSHNLTYPRDSLISQGPTTLHVQKEGRLSA